MFKFQLYPHLKAGIILRGFRWWFEVLLIAMSTYNIYLEPYPKISSPNHVKFVEIHTYYSKYSNGSLSPNQNKELPMRGAIYNLSCFSKT